jgi:predicted membrane protein
VLVLYIVYLQRRMLGPTVPASLIAIYGAAAITAVVFGIAKTAQEEAQG